MPRRCRIGSVSLSERPEDGSGRRHPDVRRRPFPLPKPSVAASWRSSRGFESNVSHWLFDLLGPYLGSVRLSSNGRLNETENRTPAVQSRYSIALRLRRIRGSTGEMGHGLLVLGEVARRHLVGGYGLIEIRVGLTALVACFRTSRCEDTSRRQLDRVRRLAVEKHSIAVNRRIFLGFPGEERGRVRMFRILASEETLSDFAGEIIRPRQERHGRWCQCTRSTTHIRDTSFSGSVLAR